MSLRHISNYAELKSTGGLKTPARWHNKGIPVVYLSETPSLAMLEILVHFEMAPDEVPISYQLLEIEYSGGRKGVSQLADDALLSDWRDNITLTQAIGDEWLSSLKGALLRVPSAVVPHSFNYLLNPRHELAHRATIIASRSHPFDSRLL